jgi:hypothetical protein
MPETKVYFFREGETVPMVDWLNKISLKNNKAVVKCLAQIELLKMCGYELHRPYADFLRDGIYELRISFQRVQYRILYFFHGQNVILLTHGLEKEGKVPDIEINRAIERKIQFEADPEAHSYDNENIL